MDKWLSVAQIKKYCLSDRHNVTIRNMLNHLVELGLAERRTKNQLYQRYLYKAKPELYKTDLTLLAMVDGRDMQESNCYTEAAIINKFRQMALDERPSVIISGTEIQKMIKSSRSSESIRLKLKAIEKKGFIRSRLIGRVYEYDLNSSRLLNTRTPESINFQGNELTALFIAHRLYHHDEQVAIRTHKSWGQTFKRMLENGYDFATIKQIIAFLPHNTHYLNIIKSPSKISSLYDTLYEQAYNTLSVRKAKRYLYKLVNGLLPEKSEPKRPDTTLLSDTWDKIETWLTNLKVIQRTDGSYRPFGTLYKWYEKSNHGIHGVEFDDYVMQARVIMYNFLTNPPESEKSRSFPDNWLRLRLNDFIYDSRFSRKKSGEDSEEFVILPESYIKKHRDDDDFQSIIEQFAAPEKQETTKLNPILAQKVNDAINILTGREKELIIHLFDFGDGEYSQADFCKKYDLSASWASELHKKAIGKLRKHLETTITDYERLEIIEYLNLKQHTADPPDD